MKTIYFTTSICLLILPLVIACSSKNKNSIEASAQAAPPATADSAEMYTYKSDKFDTLAPIPLLSSDPNQYRGKNQNYCGDLTYCAKMDNVKNMSPIKQGAWWAARCKEAAPGDDMGQAEDIYAVYFALNRKGKPILSPDTIAGAPCPPFCDDDNGGKSVKAENK